MTTPDPISHQFSSKHAEFIDSELTPLGVEQAAKQGELLRPEGVQLVVASTLNRALRTALTMFPEPPGGAVVAHEGVREWMIGPDLCPGGNASSRRSVKNKKEEFGAAVDFAAVTHDEDELWQTVSGPESSSAILQRLSDFLVWLAERPEAVVCVVMHGEALTRMFNDEGIQSLFNQTQSDTGNDEIRLTGEPANCSCHQVVLAPSDLPREDGHC